MTVGSFALVFVSLHNDRETQFVLGDGFECVELKTKFVQKRIGFKKLKREIKRILQVSTRNESFAMKHLRRELQ